jgi:carboxyl-terminal processing protease
MQVTLKQQHFIPEAILGVARNSDNSWQYFLDEDRRIAYIRVLALEPGSAKQLIAVMTKLCDAKLRGLILDLRWCPGGTLNDARMAADTFMGEYSLGKFMFPTISLPCRNAIVRYRSAHDEPGEQASMYFIGFPMVVLVNGETTGGGEMIAAVLQDNKRAFVFGQRTRGKGSVQKPIELAPPALVTFPLPNVTLKLTSGYLVRPSGKNLNRFPESKLTDEWGVRPDAGLDFRVSRQLSKKLLEWYDLQSLRPGSSNESLPLDDPDADPQRKAALTKLRQIVRSR